MSENLEFCIHKECAESQLKTEREAGLSIEGTMGYRNAGCYVCDGRNTECKTYARWSDYEWLVLKEL